MTEPHASYAAGPERKPWVCSTKGCGKVLGYMQREEYCGRMLMVCYVTVNEHPSQFIGTGRQLCPECQEWVEWEWRKGYSITSRME